ncbi:MAG: gamma-glutamyltransferase family protein [Pigmentiphaga sp.]|nr:gamma-glutamyltransferase family protein [Pigmentiphaga sp.]
MNAATTRVIPNVVCSSHHLASKAGQEILRMGGNAVDAALAAAMALTIVEPMACGIGGDAFAIISAKGRLHGLNGSGRSPRAWTAGYFQERHGGVIPRHGWDAVTVPGVVGAWQAMSARFGRLPLQSLAGPAISLAREGFEVGPLLAEMFARTVPAVADQPGFKEVFCPKGKPPAAGETFQLPGAADTLQKIAASAGRDFYEGEIAQRMLWHAAAHGAALRAPDLADYEPEWLEPISLGYKGHELYELPPNGQGIAALSALGILEHFDLAARDPAEAAHLQIEAMKLAFADLYHYVGDPAHMAYDSRQLLHPDYLEARARTIDVKRTHAATIGTPHRGDTVYVAAADAEGQMVSFIQSTYTPFGSGVVVPGTGICMQNRGWGFSMTPAHPNVVAGGKRPFHTIIPGFVKARGQDLMAFGLIGADMQPQGHVQLIHHLLDRGMDPTQACAQPRWRILASGEIAIEQGTNEAVIQGLLARGHRVVRSNDSLLGFGAAQVVVREEDGYRGGTDPRREGLVAG